MKIQVWRQSCFLPQTQQKEGDPSDLLCFYGGIGTSPLEEELSYKSQHTEPGGIAGVCFFLPLAREVLSSNLVHFLMNRCQPQPWALLLGSDFSFLTTNWNLLLERFKLITSILTPGDKSSLAAAAYRWQWWGKYSTCTPKIPKIMKKAQQMRTIFPIGLKEEIKVSTTSFRPGALLMTLKKQQNNKAFFFFFLNASCISYYCMFIFSSPSWAAVKLSQPLSICRQHSEMITEVRQPEHPQLR